MNNLACHHFTLILHNELGVLERLLRVIRHRGGRILSMEMTTQNDQTIRLVLSIVTKKSISSLQNQMLKLEDVLRIEQ